MTRCAAKKLTLPCSGIPIGSCPIRILEEYKVDRFQIVATNADPRPLSLAKPINILVS